MMAFASAIEPLRIANRLSGRDALSLAGGLGGGRPGARQQRRADDDRSERWPTSRSGPASRSADGRDLQRARRRARRAIRSCSPGCAAPTGSVAAIGAVCTGAYLLARAGLLDGHRCTIHWENLPAFREDFPDIDVQADLFEVDRNRLTCSGGTAALDMMLHLIAREHGQELATKVSEQCIVDRIRSSLRPPAHAVPGPARHSPSQADQRDRADGGERRGAARPGDAGGLRRPVAPPARAPVQQASRAARRRSTTSSSGSSAPGICSTRPPCRSWTWPSPAASSRPRTSRPAIARCTARRRAPSAPASHSCRAVEARQSGAVGGRCASSHIEWAFDHSNVISGLAGIDLDRVARRHLLHEHHADPDGLPVRRPWYGRPEACSVQLRKPRRMSRSSSR